MRHWLMHPLVFYPLAAVLALLFIAISIEPQAWPRPAAPVAGVAAEGGLVLEGEALGTPEADPIQRQFVVRNFLGQTQSLHLAVEPSQPPPATEDQGVRILLAPEAASQLPAGPVTVEVSYNPLPVNPASGLAVSLQGAAPHVWVSADLPPQPGVARVNLPAQQGAAALGLRVLSSGDDQAYGLEITRIRILPQAAAN